MIENNETEQQPEAEAQPSRIQRMADLCQANDIDPTEFGLMVLEYAAAMMIRAHDQRGDGEPSWVGFEDAQGPFRLMASRPDPSSVVLQDADGNEIKPN